MYISFILFFFVKQKTAYEMRISDWSSDVCSSDLDARLRRPDAGDVVGDDGGNDAAERRPYDVALRRREPKNPPAGAALCQDLLLYRRLSGRVGRLQPCRRVPAKIGRASCRERVCQYV